MSKSILIVILGITWTLLPLILVILSIRNLRRATGVKAWQKAVFLAVALAITVDLVSFVVAFCTGSIGGFGTHYLTTRTASWFVLGSLMLLGVAIATKISRGKLTLASFLVFALWVGSEMVA